MPDSSQNKPVPLSSKKVTYLVGPLVAAGLFFVLFIASVVLRKAPGRPEAEELLAMVAAQGFDAEVWDLFVGAGESFVFERIPYETEMASFSANSIKLELNQPLVEPVSISEILAEVNALLTVDEIDALSDLREALLTPSFEGYVDLSKMPSFSDYWGGHYFLSEVHSAGEFIEFSVSGSAYWGDNYLYRGGVVLGAEENGAQWFFTQKLDDDGRSKAPKVDGIGSLLGSIFAKVLSDDKPSVILSRPTLYLENDHYKLLDHYRFKGLAYETTDGRRQPSQALFPRQGPFLESSYQGEQELQCELLDFSLPETKQAISLECEQTSKQRADWVEYALAVADRLESDVGEQHANAASAFTVLKGRFSGVNRFGLLSDTKKGRESVVILSSDHSSSKLAASNFKVVDLYGDFLNKSGTAEFGGYVDLQPKYGVLLELLYSVKSKVEVLGRGVADNEFRYINDHNAERKGYQMGLGFQGLSIAGDEPLLSFSTVSASGNFQLEKPLVAGDFELSLADEAMFTAKVESSLAELNGLIKKESVELAQLEDEKAKLLGPVNLGNILQGEVTEKQGGKTQKAWVEVTEIQENSSGHEGVFDLKLSFRAPEDPSVQLVATGTIDLKSDSDGIVAAFIRKNKQITNLKQSKQILEGLLNDDRQLVSLPQEQKVEEEAWDPSGADYAITLTAGSGDVQVLQDVRVVGQADKRIFLSVEPTALEGESQSAHLRLGAVDGAFLESYNKEMDAIRSATQVSVVFSDSSKRYTYDLVSTTKVGTTQLLKGWAYDRSRNSVMEMTAYAAPSLRDGTFGSILVTDVYSSGNSEDWLLEDGQWQRDGSAFKIDGLLTDFHNKRGTALYSLNGAAKRPVMLANSATIDGKGVKTLLDAVGGLGAVVAISGKLAGDDAVAKGGVSAVALSKMQGDERAMEYRVKVDPTLLAMGMRDRVFFVADGDPQSVVKLYRAKGGSIFNSSGYKIDDEVSVPSVRQWSSRVFEITLPSKKGKYILTRGSPRSGNAGVIFELE